MTEPSGDTWAHCSACRKGIAFGTVHWVCSVSTCNRARMQLMFCSVPCWDSHVATLRHREAWAVEARAPTRAEAAAERGSVVNHHPDPPAAPAKPPAPPAPPQRIVSPSASGPPAPASAAPPSLSSTFDRDVLIVVSKLKKYIKDRSGMNTSDAVAEGLSDHVRAICDDAIRAAAAADRKTVLDRDVPRPRR